MTSVVAIIGGGGSCPLPFLSDVEKLQIETPYGQTSGLFHVGYCQGIKVVFLSRHGGNYRILAHQVNYRANIHALSQLKTQAILSLGSVGGITAPAGSIVIPDQLIDYTYGRATSFFDQDDQPRHIDFTDPFDAD